jgi:hypothetical protein
MLRYSSCGGHNLGIEAQDLLGDRTPSSIPPVVARPCSRHVHGILSQLKAKLVVVQRSGQWLASGEAGGRLQAHLCVC